MKDALSNWIWLVAAPRRGSALLLAATPSPFLLTMAEGFARSNALDPSDLPAFASDIVSRPDASSADPHPACVLAEVGGAEGTAAAESPALLWIVRRLLESGSGHYAAIERIRRPGTGSRARALLPSRHVRALRHAGFREIRQYYLIRSPAEPQHLVPAVRRAIVAWDRTMSSTTLRSVVRRALMMLGLHAPFFEYRLIVARP